MSSGRTRPDCRRRRWVGLFPPGSHLYAGFLARSRCSAIGGSPPFAWLAGLLTNACLGRTLASPRRAGLRLLALPPATFAALIPNIRLTSIPGVQSLATNIRVGLVPRFKAAIKFQIPNAGEGMIDV